MSACEIHLKVDKDLLNHLQNPGDHAQLTFVGHPAFHVENIYSSTPDPIVLVNENGLVKPLHGGLCNIIACNGVKSETVKIAVAPFYRDYHKTMVMKLFLGADGVVSNGKDLSRLCDFEQARSLIRKIDQLTLGIPKIIYLVGWQKGGHDFGYPYMEEVNPLLQGDERTPLDGLRKLITWARQYHTTVSLHINLMDAYEDSPYWEEYVRADVIARNNDGSIKNVIELVPGRMLHHISYTREWQECLTQRRLDRLIEMIPEIIEGGTIHVDAFHTHWFTEDKSHQRQPVPISPYHLTHNAITIEKEHSTQCEIFEYIRSKGMDVTSECSSSLRIEPFVGLQPMAWWCGEKDVEYFKRCPAALYTGGMGSGFVFGESMHGEDLFMNNLNVGSDFLSEFCKTTLPWYFLNCHKRLACSDHSIQYSNGVIAGNFNGKKIIAQNDILLQEDDTCFIPVMWINHGEKYIMVHSAVRCSEKLFKLPAPYDAETLLEKYDFTDNGLEKSDVIPVVNGAVSLSIRPDETFLLSKKI